MKRLQKFLLYLREVSEVKTSTHSIALGFGIGTFIAIIPLFGFGIFAGILVVFLYKNINKLALFGALALWNPVTLIPIYYLSFQIGDLFFGNAPIVEFKIIFFEQIYHLSRRFLLGNMIIAVLLSGTGYTAMYYIVQRIRRRRLLGFLS